MTLNIVLVSERNPPQGEPAIEWVLLTTLLIVTSDNGGVLDTNGPDHINSGTVETNRGHLHNGVLRGEKGSPFEGGTRVPFIVRWPGHVPVGESDSLICQIDMLSTFAALTGQPLADHDAPDSENILDVFLDAKKPGREWLVENGQSLRMGLWKLIPPASGAGPDMLLFHLGNDLSETHNVAAEHPAIVAKQ